MTTQLFQTNDLILEYDPEHDGGGTSIGLDFINVLKNKHSDREFKKCLDWCSGPGFIGLMLLANGYCKELSLLDKNTSALELAKKSIYNTRYNSLVKFFNLSTIKDLPDDEVFDLVVANPPHFSFEIFWQELINKNSKEIYLDKNWQIHSEFFRYIKSHLADNGIIILQESQWGCHVNTFDSMLSDANLKVKDHYPDFTKYSYPIFYLEITHK